MKSGRVYTVEKGYGRTIDTRNQKYKTEEDKAKELKHYKKEAKAVARDFYYELIMPDVYEKIDKATSCLQVANIMTYCRKAS